MKKHHVLMIERNEEGDIVAGHEVANNEWAKGRRRGWTFATPEEQAAYQQMQAEAANAANMPAEEEAEAEPEAKPAAKKPAAKKGADE